MRLFSIPPPTLLAGFLAVLIGYASSAAIIWQAAIVAGATTAQISGWMTALGLAMGVSTLTLTLWYRVPVLTAWSTPGAALLVTGLQGLTLNEAIGVFIVTNVLIVLCGITGLFARLMRIIPSVLRQSPRLFAKARKRIRIKINVGWPLPLQAFSICSQVCLVVPLPG